MEIEEENTYINQTNQSVNTAINATVNLMISPLNSILLTFYLYIDSLFSI